jgi:hypothetical protein
LGRDAASMDDRIPTFRDNAVCPSSEVTLRRLETSVADYPLTKRHITEHVLKRAVRHFILHSPVTGLNAITGCLPAMGPTLQSGTALISVIISYFDFVIKSMIYS